RVVDDRPEVLVRPVAARESDQSKARRQQPPVGEVVDRWHELFAGQVTGDAEDHQRTRTGDAGETLVSRITEWIVRYHCHLRPPAYRSTSRSSATPAARSVRCSRSTGRPCSVS